jgi:hypothetical protein
VGGRERNSIPAAIDRPLRLGTFSFLPSQHPTNSYLASSSYLFFLGGTIKLKATHIENGIPQVPKIEDTFFPECVCLSVYIPLWRIAGRPTHSVI